MTTNARATTPRIRTASSSRRWRSVSRSLGMCEAYAAPLIPRTWSRPMSSRGGVLVAPGRLRDAAERDGEGVWNIVGHVARGVDDPALARPAALEGEAVGVQRQREPAPELVRRPGLRRALREAHVV